VEEDDGDKEGEPISDATRKSGRVKVPNRRIKDYELYVTVAEEEEFLLANNEEESDEQGGNDTEISDETLSKVAQYIMVHYAEKELIKKCKKKYKPKDGQYTLDTGLKKFGDEGETAVTKEFQQFNTYNVFELLDAKKPKRIREKRRTIITHIP
jgi:hypothetical protein